MLYLILVSKFELFLSRTTMQGERIPPLPAGLWLACYKCFKEDDVRLPDVAPVIGSCIAGLVRQSSGRRTEPVEPTLHPVLHHPTACAGAGAGTAILSSNRGAGIRKSRRRPHPRPMLPYRTPVAEGAAELDVDEAEETEETPHPDLPLLLPHLLTSKSFQPLQQSLPLLLLS
ncbi:hypothetical protein DFH08DRAFT_1045923 [Mycena albidolilacea]|uniref:Uncharacterized protein n=1 Tax=Mycena albidolilacea TaxID=1033008 RepID=A0AAD6Z8C5_9AGAR|nr:hypothetical protein DFH08DRAFT_1045923 [Mycena albidolilacea]